MIKFSDLEKVNEDLFCKYVEFGLDSDCFNLSLDLFFKDLIEYYLVKRSGVEGFGDDYRFVVDDIEDILDIRNGMWVNWLKNRDKLNVERLCKYFINYIRGCVANLRAKHLRRDGILDEQIGINRVYGRSIMDSSDSDFNKIETCQHEINKSGNSQWVLNSITSAGYFKCTCSYCKKERLFKQPNILIRGEAVECESCKQIEIGYLNDTYGKEEWFEVPEFNVLVKAPSKLLVNLERYPKLYEINYEQGTIKKVYRKDSYSIGLYLLLKIVAYDHKIFNAVRFKVATGLSFTDSEIKNVMDIYRYNMDIIKMIPYRGISATKELRDGKQWIKCEKLTSKAQKIRQAFSVVSDK